MPTELLKKLLESNVLNRWNKKILLSRLSGETFHRTGRRFGMSGTQIRSVHNYIERGLKSKLSAHELDKYQQVIQQVDEYRLSKKGKKKSFTDFYE